MVAAIRSIHSEHNGARISLNRERIFHSSGFEFHCQGEDLLPIPWEGTGEQCYGQEVLGFRPSDIERTHTIARSLPLPLCPISVPWFSQGRLSHISETLRRLSASSQSNAGELSTMSRLLTLTQGLVNSVGQQHSDKIPPSSLHADGEAIECNWETIT